MKTYTTPTLCVLVGIFATGGFWMAAGESHRVATVPIPALADSTRLPQQQPLVRLQEGEVPGSPERSASAVKDDPDRADGILAGLDPETFAELGRAFSDHQSLMGWVNETELGGEDLAKVAGILREDRGERTRLAQQWKSTEGRFYQVGMSDSGIQDHRDERQRFESQRRLTINRRDDLLARLLGSAAHKAFDRRVGSRIGR